jgi:hypothetical protein
VCGVISYGSAGLTGYVPYPDVSALKRRFSAAGSTDAAVTTAAYDVLAKIVSTAPSISDPARKAALQSLAASYASSLADVDDGPFKRQGVAAGHAAADAMIAARQNDGRFGPSQWVPNSNPGYGRRCSTRTTTRSSTRRRGSGA